jgi:hypothetical protein
MFKNGTLNKKVRSAIFANAILKLKQVSGVNFLLLLIIHRMKSRREIIFPVYVAALSGAMV